MHRKNYKGRCIKKKVTKCEMAARTYSDIALAYLDVLERNGEVKSFECNVQISDDYVSDFVITKTDGELAVRECVDREKISKPMNVKLLEMSRNYWTGCGVKDWGLVVNEK